MFLCKTTVTISQNDSGNEEEVSRKPIFPEPGAHMWQYSMFLFSQVI